MSVGPNINKLGFRCVPTPTIEFRDVEIPYEHLIGAVGQAELILFHTLDFMRFGVGQARRGWLEKDDVLNTRSWDELSKLLKRV